MCMDIAGLQELLERHEDEHLEFKEAKRQFDFKRLCKYVSALSNENGGQLILGVSSAKPRAIVGTRAFADLEQLKHSLFQKFRLRIDVEELLHPNGRVLIFRIPSRPIGMPISFKGVNYMRSGESLVPMTNEMLKRIFDETTPDFSASVCPDALIEDLDLEAIGRFRSDLQRRSGSNHFSSIADAQLLNDTGLVTDGGVTYASLILLGSEKALERCLRQAEIVFEYRARESAIEHSYRVEFRSGFFLFYEFLWREIEKRNEVFPFQDGLFRRDIPVFNETVVREAILNAVSHRDYQLPGSVYVHLYPRRFEIISPGGFPAGITPENVLYRQSPRNRLVAESFQRCGLVERSGQGMDRIYRESVMESKPLPDFSGTDAYQVCLNLRSEVQDPAFLKFLEKVAGERSIPFSIEDLLVMDAVNKGQRLPERLKSCARGLLEAGILERYGKGRGARYILARRYYSMAGRKGIYTRKRGLDRETNKALLLRHIEENAAQGSPLRELMQVLPSLSRRSVQSLLYDLEAEGRIHHIGVTRASRWYPGQAGN